MPEQSNIPNNEEIEKALKEFESKATQSQSLPNQEHPISAVITPQSNIQNQSREVEGVKFDTDTETYRAIKFYKETVEPKMVKAVIKYSGGSVKNQRQAEWVLFVCVIIAIGVSLYLMFGVVVRSTPKYSLPPGQFIPNKAS